jgi:hypothetical protein
MGISDEPGEARLALPEVGSNRDLALRRFTGRYTENSSMASTLFG